MSRILAYINTHQRNENQPQHSMRIFNPLVYIEFNAAIERDVFLQQPPRLIQRRNSLAALNMLPSNLPSTPEAEQEPEPETATASTSADLISVPPQRRQRAQSVDGRRREYVGAEQLGAIIENLKNHLG